MASRGLAASRRVAPDAVRAGKLSFAAARAAEGAHVFALGVVAVDIVRAVAIGDVKRAVGGMKGDIGGNESAFILVAKFSFGVPGFLGILNGKEHFAVEVGLHDDVLAGGGEVKELAIGFFVKLQAMCAELSLCPMI